LDADPQRFNLDPRWTPIESRADRTTGTAFAATDDPRRPLTPVALTDSIDSPAVRPMPYRGSC